MRLWSIHPGYLDGKGLVALWREGLLAQKVLSGKTAGYKNHPQLTRFKNTENPAAAVAEYLRYVAAEAEKRGYNFDQKKIALHVPGDKIPVTAGQVEYEFAHLSAKLKMRDPGSYARLKPTKSIELHPSFYRVDGPVEDWEKISTPPRRDKK